MTKEGHAPLSIKCYLKWKQKKNVHLLKSYFYWWYSHKDRNNEYNIFEGQKTSKDRNNEQHMREILSSH